MTMPGHAAVHRRRLLRRTRAISLGIAGGAAVAILGLGTAFAHAIPGHGRTAGSQAAPPAHGQPPPSAVASSPATPSGSAQTRHDHGRHGRLAPPTRPPASPAPHAPTPTVTSGAS